MQQLGRYEILSELGHGAMGTVYRARDPKIGRVVAIKTIRLAGLNEAQIEAYQQRFFRESRAAGQLSHPGIVTIYDVGEDEATRTPYIVMEYVEGPTLDAFVHQRGGQLSTAHKLDLVRQVAEALDYAHLQGIVHRDIKTANLLVASEARVKITDFGIAKLTGTQFTMTGEVMGTPAYMAPEQFTGKVVDGRADLFSLGVILYWILTGEKPFAGENLAEVSFQIAFHEPIAVSERNPALGPNYDLVLRRVLAKDPAQRYPRGQELADDLADLKDGRRPRSFQSGTIPYGAERTVVTVAQQTTKVLSPVPAVPAAPGTAAPMEEKGVGGPADWRRALPRRWPLALAMLLLFLLAGAAWWWRSNGSPPEPSAPPASESRPPRVRSTTGPPQPRAKRAGTIPPVREKARGEKEREQAEEAEEAKREAEQAKREREEDDKDEKDREKEEEKKNEKKEKKEKKKK